MKYGVVDHALIGFCVLALASGQIIFKFVGVRIGKLSDLLVHPSLLAALACAIALYGASTLVWIDVLRRVPLSYAYMFMALGFVLVPLAGVLMFQENISGRLVLGACIVVVGLIVASV